MLYPILLGLMAGVQVSASFSALRLVPLTRARLAWSLMSAGLLTMAALSLAGALTISTAPPTPTMQVAILVGFLASVMWLVAILALYPHFQTAKQAEDAFHLVLENAPAVITTVDRAGVIISLNRSGAETLPGLTPGQCLYDVFPPGEDAKLRATVETVFRTARSAESETRLVGPEGIVFWYHNRAGPIRGGNANRVESVILLSTDITKRKIAEEKLRFFSTHDALTGLFNRAFFETEIERLQNGRQFPISIVVADVNRLKETNDLHGHAAGDDLLRAVAHVLRDAFRDDDVIARLGGDEFAIILNRSDELIASQAIERLRARIVQFNSGQTSFTLSLSVGSATAVKGDPLTDVIKKADDRMYEDKYRQKTSRVPE